MSLPAFPVFDLSRFEQAEAEEKQRLGREVDAICRETGFLAIRGHGVSQDVIDDVWDKARAFFDLPAETKQAVRAPYKGYPYGYLGPELEALAKSRDVDSPPDLKESFNGGPLARPPSITDPEALAFCYADTLWPDAPQGFKAAWTAYYGAMEDLAARIMRLFAVALDLPDTYFDGFITTPISALRALNYPQQHVAPKPGQLRAGAHTDYGSLTILGCRRPDRAGWRSSRPMAAGPAFPRPPAPSSSISATSWRAGPTTAGSPPCTASSIRRPKTAASTAASPSPSSTSRTGTPTSPCSTQPSAPARPRVTPRSDPGRI